MQETPMARRLAAEFLGTFCLVFIGCGAAVLAAGFVSAERTHLGIGFLGVALAFGLTVTVLAHAVGDVSGGHFNPAVTLGAAVARRFPWRDVPAYAASQVLAAITAAAALFLVATGRPGFDATASGFASNGYGDRSPGGYSLTAGLVLETVLTFVLVYVVLAVTADRTRAAVAPAAIGLCVAVIHLVAIPVTNTSVNPARSIGPALFAGTGALAQLWLFVLAPLAGAALAGLLHARATRTSGAASSAAAYRAGQAAAASHTEPAAQPDQRTRA
jgi:aquaporin Z